MKRNVFLGWAASDTSGYGVFGLNLTLSAYKNPNFHLISTSYPSFLGPQDPLTMTLMPDILGDINPETVNLKKNAIYLHPLGPVYEKIIDPDMVNVGFMCTEFSTHTDAFFNDLKDYQHIITSSTWNQRMLAENGISNSKVFQGVDTDLFQPMSKRYFKDRFVVYSGGKLEYRKGQDIVLKAFAQFAQTRPDALLLTTWRSPWEHEAAAAATINYSQKCLPLIPTEDMTTSILEWVYKNGVQPHQVMCLSSTPNRFMPDVFREVDLAVFPNRSEGATNLVAMEALSSGVLCAISKNTGHLDIIEPGNCIPLNAQQAIPGRNSEGWGESSVDELVHAMESAYNGTSRIEKQSIRESIMDFSWQHTSDKTFGVLSTL